MQSVFSHGDARQKMASSIGLSARRDDFKLAISDAFSMKGLSTMQKETKMLG